MLINTSFTLVRININLPWFYTTTVLRYSDGMRLADYPRELKSEALTYFRSLFFTPDNAEEAYMIIRHVFTPQERYSIGRRIEIAHMLSEGHKYSEIEKNLKTTSITISRVKKMIASNPNIYRRVIQRYLSDEKKVVPVKYKYSKGSLQAFGKVTKSGMNERDLKR